VFPNSHDLLPADLAELAGKDLKSVRFEEIAPRDEEDERGEGHPTLVAFMDGKRYAVRGGTPVPRATWGSRRSGPSSRVCAASTRGARATPALSAPRGAPPASPRAARPAAA
jgi:hypothetical protein